MKSKSLLAIAALVLGLGILSIPAPSDASILVTNIDVTVGALEACGTGCVNNIWGAGLGAGINLNPGDTLVVTQTGGAGSFNFDSSDLATVAGLHCSGANPCATTLSINGAAVTLVPAQANAGALANNNNDVNGPAGLTHNEAQDWVLAGTIPGIANIYFGYVDNLHTNACADSNANCVPDVGGVNLPFGTNNATNHFIGGGASGVGLGVTPGGANHCDPNAITTLCFDAGAILIQAIARVPEPSSLLLLGFGLMGMSGLGLFRKSKRS